MKHISSLILILQLVESVLVLSGCTEEKTTDKPKPNILFISIDDLNNQIGALGASHVRTPNLDKFAEQSDVSFRCKHFLSARPRHTIPPMAPHAVEWIRLAEKKLFFLKTHFKSVTF
jgi:hypothetical protein